MALVPLMSLLWPILLLIGLVQGQTSTQNSATSIANLKISQTVTLTSLVVFVCFLVEMVGIGLLIFRARRDPRENIGQWPTDNYSDASPDSESSFPRNSFSREATAKPLPQRGRYLFPEKQLPPPPSWFSSEDSESVIDVVVEPASPLLHAQFSAPPFSGTPRSSIHIFPESPIPSSNIFGAKPREVSWVAGNDLDRLTVFRTPSYFPQSSRGEHFRTTSMSAVQEGTDQPLGTAQDTEVFALQQLVAKLKGRVQELEVQNKLLQDGRWQPRSVMDHE